MSIKYINILKSIEIAEKRRKVQTGNYKNDIRYLLLIAIVSFLAVAMAIMYYFTKENFFKLTGLLLILLDYLIIPIMQIHGIYKYRYKIKRSILLPFNEAINQNIKTELFIDKMHLPSLTNLTSDELKLGLLEIKHERNFLEKRLLLLIGPIDKLGILPGIVATVAALTKIPENHSWISAIAYGYMGLTFFSLFFYHLIIRYERMMALTELAIEIKQKETTTEKEPIHS